ncbi:MAG: methyltransferase domain-containing protein [Planctomycetes bacterium]|nr:methyltransferase domain-containing protein [Planctomycetota bacterium]
MDGSSGVPTPQLNLDSAFWHSRSPTVAVGADGRIEWCNHSFKLLFSSLAGAARGQPIVDLLVGLAGESTSQKLLDIAFDGEMPDLTSPLKAIPFTFPSEYGNVEMMASLVPRLQYESGRPFGHIIQFSLQSIEAEAEYDTEFERAITQEILWEVYAASYDKVLTRLPFYGQMIERHLTAMSRPEISSVLDIGAGTGNVAAELVARGKFVTAVEPTKAMLFRLLEKTKRLCGQQLQIIDESAEDLAELKDNQFDGVTVSLAFFDMDCPQRAFQESVRLLKPGGWLAVTEPKTSFNVEELRCEAERVLKEAGLFEELFDHFSRLEHVAAAIGQVISHGRTQTRQQTGNPWSVEFLIESLRNDGFRDIQVQDSHLGNCATVLAVKGGS